MRRRIVFLGSPAAAAMVLEALYAAGHEIALVVTRPDARRGRGSSTVPTEVKKWALDHDLEVTDDLGRVGELADGDTLGVVVAFGRIIPEDLLVKMHMVNVHFSLLPRWRGAAPVERAILAGDDRTGVCIMDVEKGLDTGAVHATAEAAIMDTDTTVSLTERLARMGAQLLLEALQGDLADPVAQTGEVTYAHKVEKSEYLIDWKASSVVIGRQVRALPALTLLNGKRLRVVECDVADDHDGQVSTEQPGRLDATGRVMCGTGSVTLHRVQPEGRSAMAFREWVNGSSVSFPVILGD
ncbi:MAG: hypothetical protein RL419_1287 [Actinomycetota bacterium]